MPQEGAMLNDKRIYVINPRTMTNNWQIEKILLAKTQRQLVIIPGNNDNIT